jgi:hypothetical protein
MTTEQPLALKLADELEMWGAANDAAELRRQHAEIKALRGFAQEVRRTGDTRLASMAIAALAQGENT